MPRKTAVAETATKPKKKSKAKPQLNEDTIRLLAYQLWESAGGPITDGTEFWIKAEELLKTEYSQ